MDHNLSPEIVDHRKCYLDPFLIVPPANKWMADTRLGCSYLIRRIRKSCYVIKGSMHASCISQAVPLNSIRHQITSVFYPISPLKILFHGIKQDG